MMRTAFPYRSNSVDHVLRLQVPGRSDHCLAGWKTFRPVDSSDYLALFKYFRSASSMNRPVYSSASHQRRVGSVDYGVCRGVGDFSLNEAHSGFSDSKLSLTQCSEHLHLLKKRSCISTISVLSFA